MTNQFAQVKSLIYTFNNNPYLISPSNNWNIDSIQKFSLKIDNDTAIKKFEMKDVELDFFIWTNLY